MMIFANLQLEAGF